MVLVRHMPQSTQVMIGMSGSEVRVCEELGAICGDGRAVKHGEVLASNLDAAQGRGAFLQAALRHHGVPAQVVQQRCTHNAPLTPPHHTKPLTRTGWHPAPCNTFYSRLRQS